MLCPHLSLRFMHTPVSVSSPSHVPKVRLVHIKVRIMSTKSRKWVLKQAFDGAPKREDFEIVEEDIPPLKDGG